MNGWFTQAPGGSNPGPRGFLSRCWLLGVCLAVLSGGVLAAGTPVERLLGGDVLLLRHAIAPGFGDPEGFRVDDCATQRNLSEAGRQQAIGIGKWLREHGVENARVYSSQWCRCLETAKLLGLGEVKPLPALNSFFQRPDERAGRLSGLRAFLADQQAQGEPLILVTHQVTVTAMTGIFPASGEGVVAKLEHQGGLSNPLRLDFTQ